MNGFIEWLRSIDGSKEIINNLNIETTQKIGAKDSQISNITKQLSDMQILLTTTNDQDKKTIAELKAKLIVDPQETYWDNKYPKISRNYIREEKAQTYFIDVRNFLMPQDANLPLILGQTNDEKAYNSLMWVMNNITYTYDKPNYGYDEYWAFPFETQWRKKGDCEDGAILMASIMLKAGIPPWRVRLNAGDVNGGGHAYVTYCRETDNQFVILDWCYWANRQAIKDRKLHKDEQNYNDVTKNWGLWFSWTIKNVYGEMQTMVNMPRYL